MGFVETWLPPGESVAIKNFSCIESKSNLRKAAKGRYPGGLALYIEESFSSSEYIVKPKLASRSLSGIVWTILKGNYRVGIAIVYNPPKNSEYYRDTFFDDLSAQMAELEARFNCSYFGIFGDLNSRVGEWQNYDDENEDNEEWDTGSKVLSLPKRKSSDKEVNPYGKILQNFCLAHDLVILNGANDRMDDFYTFISATGGKSVIDLGLISKPIFHDASKS